MILFLHWQRGRGKEGLGNGYCLGLGYLITLAEGKRERGFREWLLFRARIPYYIGRGEEGKRV
jgi:hypothetical protein